MPQKLLTYLRQNLLALLALFVALGGTSYAALTINGSQIRNHTINAVKLDPRSIAGSIRARVDLQFKGPQLVATSSSAPVHVVTADNGEGIRWVHQRFSAKCEVLANAHENLGPASVAGFGDGYVNAQFIPPSNVFLRGYGRNGSPRAQAASVVVVCP